jgi:hypothetical protein
MAPEWCIYVCEQMSNSSTGGNATIPVFGIESISCADTDSVLVVLCFVATPIFIWWIGKYLDRIEKHPWLASLWWFFSLLFVNQAYHMSVHSVTSSSLQSDVTTTALYYLPVVAVFVTLLIFCVWRFFLIWIAPLMLTSYFFGRMAWTFLDGAVAIIVLSIVFLGVLVLIARCGYVRGRVALVVTVLVYAVTNVVLLGSYMTDMAATLGSPDGYRNRLLVCNENAPFLLQSSDSVGAVIGAAAIIVFWFVLILFMSIRHYGSTLKSPSARELHRLVNESRATTRQRDRTSRTAKGGIDPEEED